MSLSLINQELQEENEEKEEIKEEEEIIDEKSSFYSLWDESYELFLQHNHGDQEVITKSKEIIQNGDLISLGYMKLIFEDLGSKYSSLVKEIHYQIKEKFSKLVIDSDYLNRIRNKHEQYIFGIFYDMGIGVIKDISKAFEFWKLSADQGLALAECTIAFCYSEGYGVIQNDELALEYYRRSAQNDFSIAQCLLGAKYFNGEGVETNEQEAFRLIELAGNKGYLDGLYLLGTYYYYGRIIKRDRVKALKIFQSVNEKDNLDANYMLSLYYLQDSNDSFKSIKGFELLQDSYTYKHTNEASYLLGICYEYGLGVTINQKKGYCLYTEALDSEYPPSIYATGRCYEEGIGAKYQPIEAKRSFELAASLGCFEAKMRLLEYEEDKVKIRMTNKRKYEPIRI